MIRQERNYFMLSVKPNREFSEIWFKKLKARNDIYEFRIIDQGNCIRLFAFWDTRSKIKTLVVCSHEIIKKAKKTPQSEIIKAIDIKRKYFE